MMQRWPEIMAQAAERAIRRRLRFLKRPGRRELAAQKVV
jgi:hypothetical protein